MTVMELQNYLEYLVKGKSVKLTTQIAISCSNIIKPLDTGDLIVDDKFGILWVEVTRHPKDAGEQL